MDQATKSTEVEQTRIVLGLLEYVERGGEQSQRRLASELGVALGLVNLYVRRCMHKGLVKVRHAPARRYAYYLTPQGFAEKSRLTVEYMSHSLSLFRRAKADCTAAFAAAREHGHARMALLGRSDLAEIAMICALDTGMSIVAVIDSVVAGPPLAGVPVAASLDEVADSDRCRLGHRYAQWHRNRESGGRAAGPGPGFHAGAARSLAQTAPEEFMTAAAWHVVHTHIHAEAKAAAHLTRQGFDVYLPRYLRHRRHARKVETISAPLFPRYCFVHIDRMVQRWRSIC